jgi:hypothetical protein
MIAWAIKWAVECLKVSKSYFAMELLAEDWKL